VTAPLALDLIALSGIAGFGYHGVFESERREGQTFIADVQIGLDLSEAAQTDALDKTVHYGVLAEQVHEVLTGEALDLIETLALRIVNVCLGHDLVQWAKVTVHKPSAPIEVAFDDVAVTIERSR
jgi:7,8-dihydroneopterin aldolase/epimerase/oxygenase